VRQERTSVLGRLPLRLRMSRTRPLALCFRAVKRASNPLGGGFGFLEQRPGEPGVCAVWVLGRVRCCGLICGVGLEDVSGSSVMVQHFPARPGSLLPVIVHHSRPRMTMSCWVTSRHSAHLHLKIRIHVEWGLGRWSEETRPDPRLWSTGTSFKRFLKFQRHPRVIRSP
jgi:hypothetical protein